MAMPPNELLKMIQSQKDKATPGGQVPTPDTGAPGMGDTSAPPMASPMSTPEPKMGNREAALINIGMAMDLLEQSLPALGSESDEGRKLLAAIRSMTDVIGARKGKTGDLQQSEIMQLISQLPQSASASLGGPAGQAPMNMPPGGMPPPPPTGGAGAPPTGGLPTPPTM